ncbi:tannase and feruloyl esterase [Actinobacillus ureae]|uniref:Uncharacterized protein n=1 Tax=Actinobacillus ureae ATCC 25976 TaxID=887324 RepID=E8KEJ7_9PAST|nr:hypothetical protein [Actinobacillus ureae]EFX92689.1 hypothetical protein HMPREF0027_0264 [Actinobacillus ureae ATCC 25976]SUT88164.1 tannase and feruloyl esterase [Actinobacillus ureae]SUU50016.1 tannase and feruloyl esterase [Actinobacillus ureae]
MHKLTAISCALALMGVSQLAHATTQSDLLAAQQCAALKEAKIYDTQLIKTEWLPAGELPQDKNVAMSGASAKPVTAGAH